jgi:hypothetical protein
MFLFERKNFERFIYYVVYIYNEITKQQIPTINNIHALIDR